MENNHTEDFVGLESLGNSQVVTNISDFLSLEDLGLVNDPNKDGFMSLERTEDPITTKVEIKEEEVEEGTATQKEVELPIIPKTPEETLDNLEGLDKGEEEVSEPILPSQGTDYKSILTELIGEGLLPEIGSIQTEEGEVALEDMEIDKDTLIAILRSSQEEKLKSIKETSISVSGVSEFTKKLIEIEKHGGDVQKAIDTYQTYKDPIETIDIETPLGQKAMCYLRLQAQGIDEETAKDLIKSYELQGTLEEKAFASKEQLNQAYEASLEQQRLDAIEEDKAFKASLKNYRNSIDNVLKDRAYTDTHRRKLLDIATKVDDKGDVMLDNILNEFRRNPIDAADLLLFVTDKEGFLKANAEELLKEERKKNFKTINIIPKGSGGSLKLHDQAPKEKGDDYLLDLSKIR